MVRPHRMGPGRASVPACPSAIASGRTIRGSAPPSSASEEIRRFSIPPRPPASSLSSRRNYPKRYVATAASRAVRSSLRRRGRQAIHAQSGLALVKAGQADEMLQPHRMRPGRASVPACPSAITSGRTVRSSAPPSSASEEIRRFSSPPCPPAASGQSVITKDYPKKYVATSREKQPTLLVDGVSGKPATYGMVWSG